MSLLEDLERARAEEREACARVAEGGSFLHAEAPTARFGKECARAIRARGPAAPPKPDATALALEALKRIIAHEEAYYRGDASVANDAREAIAALEAAR